MVDGIERWLADSVESRSDRRFDERARLLT
jgi:hypothetical protein